MKKTVLVYGLISGIIVSALMGISMIVMSQDGNMEHGNLAMAIGYLTMLIAFTFIFVAVKNYRDKQNGGVISFGKAFRIGLLIALLASTLYVISWAIVSSTLLPDFMDQYCAEMIRQAQAKFSGAKLQQEIDKINWMKQTYDTPVGFILFTFMEIIPVGILVSLIAALLLKRKPENNTPAFHPAV